MTPQADERGNALSPPPADARSAGAADQGINSLVGGILADMQRLFGQQIELLHQEISDDFRKTKESILAMGAGGILALLGAMLLIPALIGVLSWAVPQIPWWGWCGILAGLSLVAAAVLYSGGKKKLESFNPLPDRSLQAAKESLEWIGKKVTAAPK